MNISRDITRALGALGILWILTAAGCPQYENISPAEIGMMLTPTGYEDKIYTPGQINIGEKDSNGQGNQLVLIQRSGWAIKEQFIVEGEGADADHRCLTADGAPMSLDIRLLFALPDYSTPAGQKDLARIFLLGNPQQVQGKDRVLRISTQSLYEEQAQQQVRGRVRQMCSKYKSFSDAFASYSDESALGMTKTIERAVGQILVEQKVPIRLVSAFVSNMKPDPTIIAAIAAQQAAEKRVEAIRTLTDFLDNDPTGNRAMVYKFQGWQEIVNQANANGHNTIFMTDIGQNSQRVVPLLPVGR